MKVSKSDNLTKELCQKEALKYKSKSEFSKNSKKYFNFSKKNNFLDEICSHMSLSKNRIIYSFEFEDNWVYVGLTCKFDTRIRQHLNNSNSPVYKHILKTNIKPKILKHSEYILEKDAQLLEENIIEYYKSNNWNLLNTKKAGGLGYSSIWSFDLLLEEALKYKTRSEFTKNSKGAYHNALKNGLLDQICKHMISRYKPKGFWENKENCITEALKYDNRTEFIKKSHSCTKHCIMNGWMDDVCKHMNSKYRQHIYWNKEKCYNEAINYDNRTDFFKKSPRAYNNAKNNEWLDDICSHMDYKPKIQWNKESCQIEALKYKSRTEFYKNNYSCYITANKEKWLDEICEHMKKINFWDIKDNCFNYALKFNSRQEFVKFATSRCYKSVLSNKWLDELEEYLENNKVSFVYNRLQT